MKNKNGRGPEEEKVEIHDEHSIGESRKYNFFLCPILCFQKFSAKNLQVQVVLTSRKIAQKIFSASSASSNHNFETNLLQFLG